MKYLSSIVASPSFDKAYSHRAHFSQTEPNRIFRWKPILLVNSLKAMIDGIGKNRRKRLIVKNSSTLSSGYFHNSEWMCSEEMVHIWALEKLSTFSPSKQNSPGQI